MLTDAINFEEEFISFKDKLHSFLYRLTANKEDAEDLLQDTFLKASQKLSTFKGKSSLKTWVFAIATNLARDKQRVQKRWALEVQDECKYASLNNPHYQNRIISVFQSQPEQKFEIVEHINYCFTCVAKNLSLQQQIVIILAEIYHFKRKEIATIIGKTEGVVKHLLHDSRKALQEKYHHRCALIDKEGMCHQCAELNDFLNPSPDSEEEIKKLGFEQNANPSKQLDLRFELIHRINPLNSKGADLEDTILQILNEVID